VLRDLAGRERVPARSEQEGEPMAKRSPQTIQKREREQAKREKRERKLEKRAAALEAKTAQSAQPDEEPVESSE
jgi:hypothetical protein